MLLKTAVVLRNSTEELYAGTDCNELAAVCGTLTTAEEMASVSIVARQRNECA